MLFRSSLDDHDYINNNYIVLCTARGIIKKTTLEAFSRPRQSGINAINIREGDNLIEAKLTNGSNEVVLAIRSGKAVRFNEKVVRPMGRTAAGVKGITLSKDPDDMVVGMVCLAEGEHDILVVSEKGYGKRSSIQDYRLTNRGGKGVKTINITEKTGKLIAIQNVSDKNDLMIINKSGITIRMPVEEMRVMGRNTQGVRLINLKNGDSIAAVTRVEGEENDEDNNQELKDTEELTQDDTNDTT